MATRPFQRLFRSTFLGILSPRYADLWGFPIPRVEQSEDDQDRAVHSARVSWLIGNVAANLQLTQPVVSYAIAWGVLHDIATWPLSHTGEAAFAETTGVDGRELRALIITGADRLLAEFSLYGPLKELNLDHGVLLALFDKHTTGLDADLAALHKVVHSALTPDSVEGMHRSGRAYNVQLPHPSFIVEAFERDLLASVRIKPQYSEDVFRFWRGKSKIYARCINSQKSIEFESMWSRATRDAFAHLTLNETLQLSEEEIIRKVAVAPKLRISDIQRYKAPLLYDIAENYKGRRNFDQPMPVEGLEEVFIKKKKKAGKQ